MLDHSGARTLRYSFAPVLGHSDTPPLPRLGLSKARALRCSGASVLGRSGAWPRLPRLFGWSPLHRFSARTPLCSATPVHYSLGARLLQRLVSPRSPCLVLSRSDARHSRFGRSGTRTAELCRSGARPVKDSSASPLRQPLSCPGALTLVTPVPAISGARIIWRSAAPPLGYSGASLSTAVPVIVRLCDWVLSGTLPLRRPLLPSAQPLQCLFPPAVGRSSDRGPKSALTEIRRFLFTFTHLLLLLLCRHHCCCAWCC